MEAKNQGKNQGKLRFYEGVLIYSLVAIFAILSGIVLGIAVVTFFTNQ